MPDFCEHCDERATRGYRGLTFCDKCAPDDSEKLYAGQCEACMNMVGDFRTCRQCGEKVCELCARTCERAGKHCPVMSTLIPVAELVRQERMAG